jgi:hypothetical protein
MKQGDFEMYCEPQGAFFSMDERAASLIVLHELAGPPGRRAVWLHRLMTERLAAWIGSQSLKRTFTSLADETGVAEGTIRNIFRDYINELEQTVRFETPKWMGIDEIHIINKPRCVVSNTWERHTGSRKPSGGRQQ